MSEINFKATFTTLSLYRVYALCPPICVCVGTKNSSFTEEQVSHNLHIWVIHVYKEENLLQNNVSKKCNVTGTLQATWRSVDSSLFIKDSHKEMHKFSIFKLKK